eukprot:jgi/Chlat1/5311/Chrsp35S05253
MAAAAAAVRPAAGMALEWPSCKPCGSARVSCSSRAPLAWACSAKISPTWSRQRCSVRVQCVLSPQQLVVHQASPSYSNAATLLSPVVPADKPPRLAKQRDCDRGKKTLVLDLDETLVHSFFHPVMDPDFTCNIKSRHGTFDVYVRKRPWLDEFVKAVADCFEVVVFTASLSEYANPLLDWMDSKHNAISQRLFREACTLRNGKYYKDLSSLGRDLSQTIIIDNSPTAYALQPANAIPIRSFYDDSSDRALLELIPFLCTLVHAEDVRHALLERLVL